jgi:frataxin-like iron-binding protein CyaY
MIIRKTIQKCINRKCSQLYIDYFHTATSRKSNNRPNLKIQHLNQIAFSTKEFTPFTRVKKLDETPDPELLFQERAELCLKKFKVALEPMVEANPAFILDYSNDELKLDVGERGCFILKIDYEVEKLNFLTPISGVFEYEYDESTHEWVGVEDRHDIREMITRDLLRYFRGCPQF